MRERTRFEKILLQSSNVENDEEKHLEEFVETLRKNNRGKIEPNIKEFESDLGEVSD